MTLRVDKGEIALGERDPVRWSGGGTGSQRAPRHAGIITSGGASETRPGEATWWPTLIQRGHRHRWHASTRRLILIPSVSLFYQRRLAMRPSPAVRRQPLGGQTASQWLPPSLPASAARSGSFLSCRRTLRTQNRVLTNRLIAWTIRRSRRCHPWLPIPQQSGARPTLRHPERIQSRQSS